MRRHHAHRSSRGAPSDEHRLDPIRHSSPSRTASSIIIRTPPLVAHCRMRNLYVWAAAPQDFVNFLALLVVDSRALHFLHGIVSAATHSTNEWRNPEINSSGKAYAIGIARVRASGTHGKHHLRACGTGKTCYKYSRAQPVERLRALHAVLLVARQRAVPRIAARARVARELSRAPGDPQQWQLPSETCPLALMRCRVPSCHHFP